MQARMRTIAYWFFTIAIAYEMVAGAFWDLLQLDFTRVMMGRLGYPSYLPYITGVWKLPCALALIAPRFQRVKEWAYAGAFFNYTGAVASHIFAGDGGKWPIAFGLAVFTVGSWALRPPERRLASSEPTPGDSSPARWLTAAGILAAMIILALLTLPKGSPP
jgi:DoxX-like family